MTDNFGRTAKFRPVVVVGVSDEELHYIPVTHSTSQKSERYQYLLKSTELNSTYEDSYVECCNVRCIPVKPYWAFPKFSKVSTEDERNIKSSSKTFHISRSDKTVENTYQTSQERL